MAENIFYKYLLGIPQDLDSSNEIILFEIQSMRANLIFQRQNYFRLCLKNAYKMKFLITKITYQILLRGFEFTPT